jgi:hypothetical protein
MDEAKERRLWDMQRFYDLLDELTKKCGSKRLLKNCNGKMKWPKRGVYFFFEPGEFRNTSGNGFRVVRVGTHALKKDGKTTLWNRLSQHHGTQKDGGGNHRGSIFRLHVGKAILHRDRGFEEIFPTWCKGSSAAKDIREVEKPLEQAVSRHIGDMPFLWLEVDDPPGPDSQRKVIERNAIGLLSNYCSSDKPIDPSSEDWLGRYTENENIIRSGLWNVDHVRECYDPAFLDLLSQFIL